jgi:hypothetical protein
MVFSLQCKIENILYGKNPGIDDTVKVVSWQSTRSLASNEFRLLEGQEYYFITHIYTKEEKVGTGPIREYEYGDVMAGTFYNLFPVNDGVVSFLGWTFKGENKTGEIATIDEESFLKQFMVMMNDAKSKLESETAAPAETTALPSEPAATPIATDTPEASETASVNSTGTPEVTETAFIEPTGAPEATPSATN